MILDIMKLVWQGLEYGIANNCTKSNYLTQNSTKTALSNLTNSKIVSNNAGFRTL